MTVHERRILICRHNFCHNCLAVSHTTAYCTSSSRCFRCNKLHHTLLHEEIQSIVSPNQRDAREVIQQHRCQRENSRDAFRRVGRNQRETSRDTSRRANMRRNHRDTSRDVFRSPEEARTVIERAIADLRNLCNALR